MHQNTSHRDPTMDNDYRPTRYGSTDADRNEDQELEISDQKKTLSKQYHKSPYQNHIWMGVLHVPIMYLILFSMVDTAGDIYQNLNTFICHS